MSKKQPREEEIESDPAPEIFSENRHSTRPAGTLSVASRAESSGEDIKHNGGDTRSSGSGSDISRTSSASVLSSLSSSGELKEEEIQNRIEEKKYRQARFTRLVDTPDTKLKNDEIREYTLQKFNEARAKLHYPTPETPLDPVILFEKYTLPSDPPSIEENVSITTKFYTLLDSKNAVAIELQQNMYLRWDRLKPWNWFNPWNWFQWAEDVRNIKAGRLVYCGEMFELFVQTLKEEELSIKQIDEMAEKLYGYLEGQKQWFNRWRGPDFNLNIQQRQSKLKSIKEKVKNDYAVLNNIQSLMTQNPYDTNESVNHKNARLVSLYEGLAVTDQSGFKIVVCNQLDAYAHIIFKNQFSNIAAQLNDDSQSEDKRTLMGEQIKTVNAMIYVVDALRIQQNLPSMKGEFEETSKNLKIKLQELEKNKNFQLEATRVAKLLQEVISPIEKVSDNPAMSHHFAKLLELMRTYVPGASAFEQFKKVLKRKLIKIQEHNIPACNDIVEIFVKELNIIIPAVSLLEAKHCTQFAPLRQLSSNKLLAEENAKAILWLALSYLSKKLNRTLNEDRVNDFPGIREYMTEESLIQFDQVVNNFDFATFVTQIPIASSFGMTTLQPHDAYQVMMLMCVVIQAERYLGYQQDKTLSVREANALSFNAVISAVIGDVLADVANKKYRFPGDYCVTLAAMLKLDNSDATQRDEKIEQLLTKANEGASFYESKKSQNSIDNLKAAALKAVGYFNVDAHPVSSSPPLRFTHRYRATV